MPRIANLPIEILEAFYEVVKHKGDAGKARKELGVEQPAMSKRLARLQYAGKPLRCPWLVRDGKQWEPTAEGRNVWQVVKRLVEDYRGLTGFAQKPADRQALRFACGQFAAETIVKDALGLFRESHRGVRVWISTMRGEHRIAGVANASLDLAMVTHRDEEIRFIARRDLHIDELEIAPMVLVSARDTPWAHQFRSVRKGKPLTLSDLEGFPLILPEADSELRKGFDLAVERQRGELQIDVEIGGWPSIIEYVAARHGVGVVSAAAVPAARGLLVRSIDPRVCAPSTSKLICRRLPNSAHDLDLSAPAAAWRDTLLRLAEKSRFHPKRSRR